MSDIESRVAALEQAFARIDEKLSVLPKIEAQLSMFGAAFITRHECDMQHGHTSKSDDDLHKRIDAANVRIDQVNKDMADRDKTSMVRMWAVIVIVIGAAFSAIFVKW